MRNIGLLEFMAMSAVIALLCATTITLCHCGPTLTPNDRADLAAHAATLEKCQEEGRELGKDGGLAQYERCKKANGIGK